MGLIARIHTALYDRALAPIEEAGLRDLRAGLIARAGGDIVELGAGTGLNLAHYGPAVRSLVLTEPEHPMAQRLERRRAELGIDARVIEAGAERLPLEDASADTVVATLVLCTVEDPAASIAEVRRVLRPGGRFLFLEHVRSDQPDLARWQDRLERPWKVFGDGCHPNRDTLAVIADGLEVKSVDHGRVPKAPKIVRPLITGVAVKPG